MRPVVAFAFVFPFDFDFVLVVVFVIVFVFVFGDARCTTVAADGASAAPLLSTLSTAASASSIASSSFVCAITRLFTVRIGTPAPTATSSNAAPPRGCAPAPFPEPRRELPSLPSRLFLALRPWRVFVFVFVCAGRAAFALRFDVTFDDDALLGDADDGDADDRDADDAGDDDDDGDEVEGDEDSADGGGDVEDSAASYAASLSASAASAARHCACAAAVAARRRSSVATTRACSVSYLVR
jgi:hypothetical protein